jgi:hypothetical protein
MGQLYDWEGLLGHKRPTGMMSIFGALQFTTAMGRKSSCPVGAFARSQSTRRLVRRKAVLGICYNGSSRSASEAPSSMHFQSSQQPQVHRSL